MVRRLDAKLDFYGSLCLLPFILVFGHHSLSRVLPKASSDLVWRRMIIGCALIILAYNLACLMHGLSSLFFIHERSPSDSTGMLICRASVFILDLCGGWMYTALAWFFFRRLQIAFAHSSGELAISDCTARIIRVSLLVESALIVPLAIWAALRSVRSVGLWGYQCQFRHRWEMVLQWYAWYGWSCLWIVTSMWIAYLYISKLRMIRQSLRISDCSSMSLKNQNDKIELTAKKAGITALVSCLLPLIIPFIYESYWIWSIDAFLNGVLIFCNFEVGNRLFLFLFGWLDCCISFNIKVESDNNANSSPSS